MLFIKDEEFIRGKVPMTKEEVRHLTIAKLELEPNMKMIDIGAGSGSVGIEATRFLYNGFVYGIETNLEGIRVINENLNKFNVKNYQLFQGMAPDEIPSIELLDRAFIGGSKGNMEGILKWFKENSKEDGLVVINTITLESLSEAMEGLKKLEFTDIDVVNVNISTNKKIGRYNMMIGENPIYIISARRSI